MIDKNTTKPKNATYGGTLPQEKTKTCRQHHNTRQPQRRVENFQAGFLLCLTHRSPWGNRVVSPFQSGACLEGLQSENKNKRELNMNVQRKGAEEKVPLGEANSASMSDAPCDLASSEMNVDLPQPDKPTTAMAISLDKSWVHNIRN
jgi:hypothetical protein